MKEFDLCDLCNELPDCNECKHINLTELEQNNIASNKYVHYCYKYKTRLLHNTQKLNHDNFIYPCEECIMDDYKEFKER